MFGLVRNRKKKRVVYTCIFGHSELFQDFAYKGDDKTDFICFTDDPDLRSSFWDIRLCSDSLLDSHRYSKSFKQRPHKVLSEYNQSIYIDNTVKLKKGVDLIFKILEECENDIVLFNHPWRDCIYDEAQEVIKASLDDHATVQAQMDFYKYRGYPEHNGLHAMTMILRNHMNDTVVKTMEMWHDQVLRYSKRDQLSFEVCRSLTGLNVTEFPGELTNNEIMQWPVIIHGLRLPRDFDDSVYLHLNPDVARLGINPRKHYLLTGITEGRPYK